jgi:TolB protein
MTTRKIGFSVLVITEILFVVLSGCRTHSQALKSTTPPTTQPTIFSSITPTTHIYTTQIDSTSTPIPLSLINENIGPFAVITDNQIEILDESGKTLQIIKTFDQTFGSFFPYLSWKPDGTSLAYVELGTFDIKIIDLSNLNITNLTNSPDIFERDPSWSPDAKHILYSAAYQENSAYKNSLFIVNNDGKGKEEIYRCDAECIHPDWSPDGTRIAFEENGDLFVLELASGNILNLTNGNGFNAVPRWSPDGLRIAFIHGEDVSSRGYLATISSNGENLKILTDESVMIWWYIEWSPLGRYLLVSAEIEGQEPAIYAFDIVNNAFIPLNDYSNGWPVWFPLALPILTENDFIRQESCAPNDWSKINTGDWVKILGENGGALRARSSPEIADNTIALLPAGGSIQIIEGPVCSGKYVFWKALGYTIPGAFGWVAEGDGDTYYLTPRDN